MPTPCNVTGTLQTLTSGRIAQGKVIFQLTNIGTGNPIGVSGTSIIPALTYTVMTAQDGTFAVSLWGNDVLTPSNTLYSVTFRDFLGNEIGPILYSITGSNANLNTLIAAGTILPPVIVGQAIISNPAAPQSIAGQPLSLSTSAPLFVANLNTILFADQFPGADASIKINAAIAALPSTGGTVDARGLGGVQFISQQINVGNSSSKPVTLILPTNANWGVTINNPASAAVMMFNNSALIADTAGTSNQATISSSSASTSVLALLATDISNGNTFNTFKISGVSFHNVNGGTMADSVVLLRSFKDNSLLENSNITNPFGVGLRIGGTVAQIGGGPITIRNVWVNGGNGGTSNTVAQPVIIQGNSNAGGQVTSVHWLGGSVVQPGSGQNGIFIDGGSSFFAADIVLESIHMEGTINAADAGTPMIRISHAGPVTIKGGTSLFSFANGAYFVRMENSANSLAIMGVETGHTQFVNNAVTGINTSAVAGNDNIIFYSDTSNVFFGGLSLLGVAGIYNNIPTVSGGIPAEYAAVDLTGQVAPIAATTLYTPTATGMFRISAYLKITTAGTSPVLGPVTITYTDGIDSVAQSVVMAQQLQTGAMSNTGNNVNTTVSVLTGSLVIFAKTGVAIQYAVAFTGTIGAAQYEVHLKLEAM